MEKTKIQIKSILRKLIFEYECDTIKECLIKSLESDAHLPVYSRWNVSIKNGGVQIGCEWKTLSDWDKWFASDAELSTKRGTEDFKRIEAHYKAVKAYMEHLK